MTKKYLIFFFKGSKVDSVRDSINRLNILLMSDGYHVYKTDLKEEEKNST